MFNEANAVEALVLDTLDPKRPKQPATGVAAPRTPFYAGDWVYVPALELGRAPGDVLVEPELREALIRLNPEIAERPDRADEVIYKLRAILLSVGNDGLVRANEEFAAWLKGERSMPFGPNNEHRTVHLIDLDDIKRNHFIATNQYTYKANVERRFDIVLLVNGIPLVIGEAKTPVRPAVTWFDGAHQINVDYENNVPQMFVPNVFSFATDGKEYKFGSIKMPLELWAPWRDAALGEASRLPDVRTTVSEQLKPEVVLGILRHFTVYATDKKHRKIKMICRYQQYYTTNQIVDRVMAGSYSQGAHLALPGIRQVAAHGVRRTEAAAASRAEGADSADRRRPHRP